jgi:hypothetical protein
MFLSVAKIISSIQDKALSIQTKALSAYNEALENRKSSKTS